MKASIKWQESSQWANCENRKSIFNLILSIYILYNIILYVTEVNKMIKNAITQDPGGGEENIEVRHLNTGDKRDY